MTAPRQPSELVSAVFQAWRSAGISFLVLRKDTCLPQSAGLTVEVLLSEADRHRAEWNLVSILPLLGFRLHNRSEISSLRLDCSNLTTCFQIRFDLLTIPHDSRYAGLLGTEMAGEAGKLLLDEIRHNLHQKPRRKLNRLFHPPGVVVVLCGPDGSGKSTAANSLMQRLSTSFAPQDSLHCHWKPWAGRKSPESRASVTRPHEQHPRNPIASLAYFSYHWLGFFAGMLINVPRFTCRGGLVLIERFYYDFFVDVRRYRLRLPSFIIRCGYRLLPKPDLVFLLDAPADTLQHRKQEVSPTETARQRTAYRDLVSSLANGRVIDATLPAAEVENNIVRHVLDFLALRTEKRLDPAKSAPSPGHTPATASSSPQHREV